MTTGRATLSPFVVAARSVALRLPLLYRAMQTGAVWRLRGLLRPSYEPEFRAIEQLVPTDRVHSLIDVGANFGQSITALKRTYPKATILAFEPNQALAARLDRLYSRDALVQIKPIALGMAPGSATLYMPTYNGIPFPGLASLDEAGAHRWFSPDSVLGYRNDRFRARALPVQIDRLDEHATSADFIKVDVEGHELDVLAGGLRLIEASRPALLIECSGSYEQVLRLLAPFGYEGFELLAGQWVASQGRQLNQLFLVPGMA